MNELFDKLILRVVFTLFICLIIFIYKYIHVFLYPSSRLQVFKRFYPSKNSPDTIHLFSRLIGLGIIFSEFTFFLSNGFFLALLDFFIQAILVSSTYLISIYILESIVLYNFEYNDEIIKRKNLSYAVISFAQSIGLAYILKTVLSVAQVSIPLFLFLWLFAIVVIGFATKTYSILSNLNFNRLLVQKDMSLALSYLGFFWGWTLIISSSLQHELKDIQWYAIQAILKILLTLIILPIFRKNLIWIFRIQDDLYVPKKNDSIQTVKDSALGYGIFEGAIFFTSCFLTSVITGNINFGTFYPIT